MKTYKIQYKLDQEELKAVSKPGVLRTISNYLSNTIKEVSQMRSLDLKLIRIRFTYLFNDKCLNRPLITYPYRGINDMEFIMELLEDKANTLGIDFNSIKTMHVHLEFSNHKNKTKTTA